MGTEPFGTGRIPEAKVSAEKLVDGDREVEARAPIPVEESRNARVRLPEFRRKSCVSPLAASKLRPNDRESRRCVDAESLPAPFRRQHTCDTGAIRNWCQAVLVMVCG